MDELVLQNSSPSDLFFAGPDEEQGAAMTIDTARSSPGIPQTPQTLSSHASTPQEKLFLDDSDDEVVITEEVLPTLKRSQDVMMEDTSDVEIVGETRKTDLEPGTSSRINLHRQSPSPVLQKSLSSNQLQKKRRLSPQVELAETSGGLLPAYLGEVLVPNAWSTISGRGYVKPNDIIHVRRDHDETVRLKSKSSHAANPKKKLDNKKQVTLTSMIGAPSQKVSKKKKPDTIVRLVTRDDVEFGRLPTEMSWWVSKLLELGMVEIQGVMTDCPERLTTGVGLIVTLRIYILAAAFRPLKSSNTRDDTIQFGFLEGLETEEESALRERKDAIVKLFDVLGLKPVASTNPKGKKSVNGVRKRVGKHPGKRVKEIVGDGEEIEVDDGEELSKNEIDSIYNRAQKHDQNLNEMEPAETFSLNLRGYQKQALFWMHSLETGSLDAREATSMHPLWSQYLFPQEPGPDRQMIDLTADEHPFYFNPYSAELSLEFPKAERNCKGGILADGEATSYLMTLSWLNGNFHFDFLQRVLGMGKTIMLSALIQTSLPDQEAEEDATFQSKGKQLRLNNAFRPVRRSNKPPSATLVVAPTSLLHQWEDELKRSSKPGTLDIFVWHGQNRLDLEGILENNEDDKGIKIVITSYGVLASEHARMERQVFDIIWWRVILDEAHSCKSRTSKTAKAVYALSAKRKWTVTGTPIINRLEDLYSLLKFLDFKPWSEFPFFRSFITIPFLANDPKAIEVVQIILESILLRREKTMTDIYGKRIVELPNKEVTVEELEFSPLERKIYDSIYLSAKKNFEQLDAKGLLGKNYTHILAMLMRLRRAVLHPSLVLTKDDERALSPPGDDNIGANDLIQRFAEDKQPAEGGSNAFVEQFIANLKGDDIAECPICFSEVENPMVIPQCMHQFCKDCIISHIGINEERSQQPNCPSCNCGPIKSSNLVELIRKDNSNLSSSQASRSTVILRRNDFQSSTKLDALIQSLRKLRAQDPCFRAVIFSQFTSFLDLIQMALNRELIEHYRFDGTMDVKKKAASISEFKAQSRKPKILVISLKAGGVGLNLTTANHVFMMDCWWNAAVENQAIDRVHRIGQEKTVYVTHFIVHHTIEKRILEIQKRKTAIVNEAFRGSAKADPESIQNLKIMFGDD